MEDSLHPSDGRLGLSEHHGKRQLLLALLVFVRQQFEQLLASRRALLIGLDGNCN